jgi:HEAT repeat protein
MIMQGAPAVAPLSQVLADESASSQHRIVACKILSQLPGSKTALMGAVDTGKKEVRVNVVQALGRVKPADKEVIAKLIELVKADDVDIQRYAVASLGKQGKAAKDAVPLVQSILNDKKYNDTVRAEARKTLKEIDPRKGLMSISGQEGK